MQGCWGQRVKYYGNKFNIRNPDPRKIFDEDFCKELDVWYELGDNLVIGIDANDDAQQSYKQTQVLVQFKRWCTQHAY